MTITARAREIVQQTDDVVVQTVRFFNNGVQVKDAPVTYRPGADQSSAVANLTAVVKTALASRASDGSSVAVTPGTMLDLADPADTTPKPPAGFAAWQSALTAYIRLRRMLSDGVPSVTQQRVSDAKAAADALYQASFEDFV